MKLFKKEYSKNQILYGGLIITFAILYLATAFVSWYHAITFFNIANAVWLSVILSFVAEIGQASALFSLLLTDNTKKFLTWAVMVILTALQVIGNVVSSYDWIITHNSAGVESFQKSILFWMVAADPEIFKVVIAWISGALLPVIALSMTALVAQNIDLRAHKAKTKLDDNTESDIKTNMDIKPESIDAKDIIGEVSKIRPNEEELLILEKFLSAKQPITVIPKEETVINTPDQSFSEETTKNDGMYYMENDYVSDPDNEIGVTNEESIEIEEELMEPEESIEESVEPEGDEEFSNSISSLPEFQIEHNNGLVENNIEYHTEEKPINEERPSIELENKPNEISEAQTPVSHSPPIEHLTTEQLERIRQIARERLLKKK